MAFPFLLERRNALAETLARARAHSTAAVEALSIFPDGPLRRALETAERLSAQLEADRETPTKANV